MLGVEASSIIVIPVFVALVPLDVPVLYIIIFVEGVIGITRRPEVDSFFVVYHCFELLVLPVRLGYYYLHIHT